MIKLEALDRKVLESSESVIEEEALRTSQKQLNDILESSPIGIAINSSATKERIYTNRRFNEMFTGDPEKSLVGSYFSDTFVEKATEEALWKSIVEKGFHHDDAEAERKCLDGSAFWCLHNWRPVKHWGEDAYMVWHHDITDRKALEKEVEARLTPREQECLQWLSKGLRNEQIADRLDLRPITVAFHITNARHKLGARTREQALAIAVHQGLVRP